MAKKLEAKAGVYYIKIRGRGVTKATLSAKEASVLFSFCERGIMELESVTLEDYYTPEKPQKKNKK